MYFLDCFSSFDSLINRNPPTRFIARESIIKGRTYEVRCSDSFRKLLSDKYFARNIPSDSPMRTPILKCESVSKLILHSSYRESLFGIRIVSLDIFSQCTVEVRITSVLSFYRYPSCPEILHIVFFLNVIPP